MCRRQRTEDRGQRTTSIFNIYYEVLYIIILEEYYKLGLVCGETFAEKYG